MKIKILTLFPEMLEPMLDGSILGRARRAGLLETELINIRDYSNNKHKNTDDYPFGGGAGMVMMPQPVIDAVEANSEPGMRRIYMSPRGRRLDQHIVEELSRYESLLFLCGHYEGVDQRALDACIDEELSIGDYVLTGGELGALVTVDAVSRLIPGVLGSAESGEDESFTTGLLEYPQYTRPAVYRDMPVPDVLLGGNHADIVAWRREESLKITRERRPELLETAPLEDRDREALHKMDIAENMINALRLQGISAHRMEYFREKSYAKEWFAAFVPAEKRSSLKRTCFSGKRHIGYLSQAFEQKHLPCLTGSTAEAALRSFTGRAVLYLNREDIALEIDCGTVPPQLPSRALLTDMEFTQTWIADGKNQMYFLTKSMLENSVEF